MSDHYDGILFGCSAKSRMDCLAALHLASRILEGQPRFDVDIQLPKQLRDVGHGWGSSRNAPRQLVILIFCRLIRTVANCALPVCRSLNGRGRRTDEQEEACVLIACRGSGVVMRPIVYRARACRVIDAADACTARHGRPEQDGSVW